MSTDLPTEEDVLAALILRWLENEVPGAESASGSVPEHIIWVSGTRARWCAPEPEFFAAIADSERRLAVERAEREVLDAAKVYHDARCNWANGVDGPDIEEAADAVDYAASAMEDARVMAGVYDAAEVSRHGG